MASLASRKTVLDSPAIPDRLYFKIGDVAQICGVETYVLRFWETQFPQLKPNKSGTGQRLYRRRDVELALEIKRLVHGEGYTLSGARHALESGHRRPEAPAAQPVETASAAVQPSQHRDAVTATIGRARAELSEILALLSAPHPRQPRPRARFTSMPRESESLFPL